MSLTKGRIDRTGIIKFQDAKLMVWEEGIRDARDRGGWDAANAWERQFKHDVFARIVQTLNRLGWTCIIPPEKIRQYGQRFAEGRRYCTKGDLQADLRISGRCIELSMFQAVNCPTRPDHGGRYEWDKEACMPYLLRLEMERTRCRIRDYLCNVFTGYVFEPPRASSPNPDPLVYFNSTWNGEYERQNGTDRFERGADGWPCDKALSSWPREDKDGTPLNHGDTRWMRDHKGRLIRGKVYGGINGMWIFVYGPDRHDFAHGPAKAFFAYHPSMPRKAVDPYTRKRRLESELQSAVSEMNFERAAILRDVIRNDEQRKAA